MTFDEVVPSNIYTDRFYSTFDISRAFSNIVNTNKLIRLSADTEVNSFIYLFKNRRSDQYIDKSLAIKLLSSHMAYGFIVDLFRQMYTGLITTGEIFDIFMDLIIRNRGYMDATNESTRRWILIGLITISTSIGLHCVMNCVEEIVTIRGGRDDLTNMASVYMSPEIESVCDFLLSERLITKEQIQYIAIVHCIPSMITPEDIKPNSILTYNGSYPNEKDAVKIFEKLTAMSPTLNREKCFRTLANICYDYYFPSLIAPLFNLGIKPNCHINLYTEVSTERRNRYISERIKIEPSYRCNERDYVTTFIANILNMDSHYFMDGIPSISVCYLLYLKGIKFIYPIRSRKLILLSEKFMGDRFKLKEVGNLYKFVPV
jgi:hypothetical protein